MATIPKPTGKLGTRWQARVRKTNAPFVTETFTYKADAEAWSRKIEHDHYGFALT